jgi:hypothetical protein
MQRRLKEARAAAKVLRTDFGGYIESMFLASTATACRISESTYHLLDMLHVLRNSDVPNANIPSDAKNAIEYISRLEREAADIAGIQIGFAK